MRRRTGKTLFICLCGAWILLAVSSQTLQAKKIKNSFKIEKEKKAEKRGEAKFEGMEINIENGDSLAGEWDSRLVSQLKSCSFAGYDKEPNSNTESFILINNSERPITGFEISIDYLDMQDRMLHSRKVKEPCLVPPGETRRFDIKSWDTQRTYYYYLGNQPKRVATPFKVAFHPLSFWVVTE